MDRLYLYKGRSQWDWWACVALSVVGDGGHGHPGRDTYNGLLILLRIRPFRSLTCYGIIIFHISIKKSVCQLVVEGMFTKYW